MAKADLSDEEVMDLLYSRPTIFRVEPFPADVQKRVAAWAEIYAPRVKWTQIDDVEDFADGGRSTEK